MSAQQKLFIAEISAREDERGKAKFHHARQELLISVVFVLMMTRR